MLRTHNRTRMGSRRCRGEVWCDDNHSDLNPMHHHYSFNINGWGSERALLVA